MKVLLVNGSSHVHGTTNRALEEMVKVFEAEGVESEIVQLGGKPLADCLACGKCAGVGHCAFGDDDGVNDFIEKAFDADGFVFASPTYFAHSSGRLFSFLDRVFYACGSHPKGHPFTFKPGAAVVVARRGGTSTNYDDINKYFSITQMPIVSSTYWNMVFGRNAEDAEQDAEGLQTVRNLARNMVWMMRCFEAGHEAGIDLPTAERGNMTNFIR